MFCLRALGWMRHFRARFLTNTSHWFSVHTVRVLQICHHVWGITETESLWERWKAERKTGSSPGACLSKKSWPVDRSKSDQLFSAVCRHLAPASSCFSVKPRHTLFVFYRLALLHGSSTMPQKYCKAFNKTSCSKRNLEPFGTETTTSESP